MPTWILLLLSCQILLYITPTFASEPPALLTVFSTLPGNKLQSVRCSGVPLPLHARVYAPEQLEVKTLTGEPVPFSAEPLMRWGAVEASVTQAPLRFVRLCVKVGEIRPPHFELSRRDKIPALQDNNGAAITPLASRVRWSSLQALDERGRALRILPRGTRILSASPLEQRVELEALGTFDPSAGPEHVDAPPHPVPAIRQAALLHSLRRWPLQLRLVLRSVAGSDTLQLSLSVLNRQPAGHPGNVWELGASGAQLFRSLSWHAVSQSAEKLLLSPEPGLLHQGLERLELVQSTASPEQRGEVRHRDARGQLPPFLGYRLWQDALQLSGAQAEPVAALEQDNTRYVLVPDSFWQYFPKGLRISHTQGLTLELLPPFGDPVPILHELQGGEQLTYRWWQAVEPSHTPFEPDPWREPSPELPFQLSPRYWAESNAGFLPDTPLEQDVQRGIEGTLRSAFIPTGANPRTFQSVAMRHEAVGWRDVGELQADHETRCGQQAYDDPTFISNYNNQYDPAWGAWRQCGRRSHLESCALALRMSRHLADIDVYHTEGDRAVYNGGQFWHTTHDTSAGLSSHRSYPRLSDSSRCTRFTSGGPGLGQLYLEGLVQAWLWSGEQSLHHAAETLGQFMLNRWRLDPRDREPRASANVLRSSTTLCGWRGRQEFCQQAERVVREGPHSFAKIPTWQEAMYGQALGYWLEQVRERRRVGLNPPDAETVRVAQQHLSLLCDRISTQQQALNVGVDMARYADVLAFGLEHGLCPASTEQALLTLWTRLDKGYWAAGTYSNTKELSILLTSGGVARHQLARLGLLSP
ncbi:MAG: hypothetical protein ACKO6N_01720 [Myxococcota bacterium]